MKKLLAVLLAVAVPAAAEETCADAPPNVTGDSACLEQGEPAPFRARALSFPEHLRREKVNERNATLWADVTQGDVVVVSKPAFYARTLARCRQSRSEQPVEQRRETVALGRREVPSDVA